MEERSTYQKVVYGIVLAMVILTAVIAVVQFSRAERLQAQMENTYVRAFHDTVDYVRDIDVLLEKTMLVSNPRQLSDLSAQIYMQAASAKASIGQLPVSDAQLDNTSKFLSQVGDFTAYLSSKVIDSGSISEEEYQSLKELSGYADSLCGNLLTMQNGLYDGSFHFAEIKAVASEAEEPAMTLLSGMEQVEKEFQDYPSLIYDGPFSEHIEQMEPAALKGKAEVSQEQAAELAGYFLGEHRAAGLHFDGENENGLRTYAFSAYPEDNRAIYAEVTKQDGMMLWFLDNRAVGEETIDWQRAGEIAKQYLESMGYTGMQQSYYEKNDGIATLNFAYADQGVIMYSDLIKVKVALDNGEVVGFESKGYLMSHTHRAIPQPGLSEAEARQKVNKHLSVDSVRMAYIPKESKREVFCYEFKGTFDDKNFLIYINANTGKEEKILMLLESESGILTM